MPGDDMAAGFQHFDEFAVLVPKPAVRVLDDDIPPRHALSPLPKEEKRPRSRSDVENELSDWHVLSRSALRGNTT
jgi:hypothetical protein